MVDSYTYRDVDQLAGLVCRALQQEAKLIHLLTITIRPPAPPPSLHPYSHPQLQLEPEPEPEPSP